jgi:Ger(x)C family germination protein
MLQTIKKFVRNFKRVLIASIVTGLYIFSKFGNTYLPIEQLSIPSAIGYDIKRKNDDVTYRVPISIYSYPDDSISSIVLVGSGDTIPRTRGTRQLEMNGKFIVGLEKVQVISEDAAKYSIRNWLDILWANRTVNDTSFMVVSKQSAEDIIRFRVEGYPSSGDYLLGMIKHLNDYNFLSDNYRLIDVFIRADSEGRSVVLPYVEILEDRLKITGLALFKDDNMVRNIDIIEARTMSLLRENNVRGIIQLRESAKDYLSFGGTSKRKVTCEKVNGKYIFNIELNLKGEILSNILYDNLVNNPEELVKIEKQLAEQTEKESYEFIKKMQNEYKIDCLELGRVAVEKYGRRKNINWDEVVSQSQINVSAKVKITEIGRGDY